ncbi:MAG TPA: shikimate kinase [Candidatus Onthomonas avicola]|nr:shikimate kinase [Candidatus Onthomonas avicola]
MRHIVLIGMMGCGKTTCGKLLSARLGRPLVDTDRTIEQAEGCSISELFARHGEAYFRDRETALVRELSRREGLILATGGGLPLREENRTLLRGSGIVFFLRRPPEVIFDATDLAGRPLARQGREDFLRRYREREPVYRAAAHYAIDNTGTPEEAVRRILACLAEEPL